MVVDLRSWFWDWDWDGGPEIGNVFMEGVTTCLDYEFHGCGAIDPETGFQRLGVF